MVEQSPKGKLGHFNLTDVQLCAGEWEDYKRLFLIHLDAKGLYNADGKLESYLKKWDPTMCGHTTHFSRMQLFQLY